LDVWPIPMNVGLMHRIEHAAVDGLEPVAHIGQRTSHDYAHGVIEIGAAHFLFEAYWERFLGELIHVLQKVSARRVHAQNACAYRSRGAQALAEVFRVRLDGPAEKTWILAR